MHLFIEKGGHVAIAAGLIGLFAGGVGVAHAVQDGWTHDVQKYVSAACLTLGAAVVIATYAYSQTQRLIAVRRFGERRLAKVVNIIEQQNSGTPSGMGYMILRLETGERCETQNQPIRHLQSIGIGTRVTVFVLGKIMVWEGDVGPRDTHRSDLPKVTR